MVQLLVHIRPADTNGQRFYEVLDCTPSTSVKEIKGMIYHLGIESGAYNLPEDGQELVFLEERCEDAKLLQDYGINNEFIVQVAGFVINPDQPGKHFRSGVLVPYD